jgi:hypothetical protein
MNEIDTLIKETLKSSLVPPSCEELGGKLQLTLSSKTPLFPEI